MSYPKWFREKAAKELGHICRYVDVGGECRTVGGSRDLRPMVQLHSISGLHKEELSDAQFLCTVHHQGGAHAGRGVVKARRNGADYGGHRDFMECVALCVDPLTVERKGLRKQLEAVRRQWWREADMVSWQECWAGAAQELRARLLRSGGNGLDVFERFEEERAKCGLTSEGPSDCLGSSFSGNGSKAHLKVCRACKQLCEVDGNIARRKCFVCRKCVGRVVLLERGYGRLDSLAAQELLGLGGIKSLTVGRRKVDAQQVVQMVKHAVRGRQKMRRKQTVRGNVMAKVKVRLRRNVGGCLKVYSSTLEGLYELFRVHPDLLSSDCRFMSAKWLKCFDGDGVEVCTIGGSTVRGWARTIVREWHSKFPECFKRESRKSVLVDEELLRSKVESYRIPTSESQKTYYRKKYEREKVLREWMRQNSWKVEELKAKAGIS